MKLEKVKWKLEIEDSKSKSYASAFVSDSGLESFLQLGELLASVSGQAGIFHTIFR